MKDVHQENMRKNKKILHKWGIFGCFFLAAFFFISGCHKREEVITEITMIHGWGSSDADHEAMRQIYKDFEKEHPDIRLNMISMPSNVDVIDKMGDLLTVGQIPDIVFTAGDGRESIYSFMVEK